LPGLSVERFTGNAMLHGLLIARPCAGRETEPELNGQRKFVRPASDLPMVGAIGTKPTKELDTASSTLIPHSAGFLAGPPLSSLLDRRLYRILEGALDQFADRVRPRFAVDDGPFFDCADRCLWKPC